jgi:predicted CXXCH cytochrome family protein
VKSLVAVVLAMLLAMVPEAIHRAQADGPRPRAAPPLAATSDGYVSSDVCRSCHPAEYASWHRSYHRTMTQRASAEVVRGPDEDVAGFTIRRAGDEVWAEGRRLALATGSHHYQAYWFEGGRPGELQLLPFVYLFNEARWIPRRAAFLQPPDAPERAVSWAGGCIACHATAGQPGHETKDSGFDTKVVELGIACEACHGPGGEHARSYRDPLRRYGAAGSPEAAEGIVNPARLDADRASMVCGQCHAFTYPKDEDEWWRRGYVRTYRPGDDLFATRTLIDGPNPGVAIDADVASMFWPDGTVRVGGREYGGMVASACFQQGAGARRLSCLSCHSMHESDPAGQLRRDRPGNEACLACHEDERGHTHHTHHQEGSIGSLCVSCHMPKTTYALLKGIASHRIDSPRVAGPTERPSACNLCHLDRTLAWTAGWLHTWYGLQIPDAARAASGPAGPGWLLSGDAALRVIAASAFGEAGARQASGSVWQAPILARALEDPYAAVRIAASRSIHALPGFEDVEIDPLGAPDELARARRAVETRASRGGAAAPQLDDAAMDALVARRDDRAISISE